MRSGPDFPCARRPAHSLEFRTGSPSGPAAGAPCHPPPAAFTVDRIAREVCPVLSRLVRRALVAASIAAALAAPAWTRPLPPADAPSAGLAPLWADAGTHPRGRHASAQSRAPLAPFAATAIPEDAAWEGFVTPASRQNAAMTIEFQGKLVIQNTG